MRQLSSFSLLWHAQVLLCIPGLELLALAKLSAVPLMQLFQLLPLRSFEVSCVAHQSFC